MPRSVPLIRVILPPSSLLLEDLEIKSADHNSAVMKVKSFFLARIQESQYHISMRCIGSITDIRNTRIISENQVQTFFSK